MANTLSPANPSGQPSNAQVQAVMTNRSNFLTKDRRKYLYVNAGAYQDGGTLNQQLNQTGLLDTIYLFVTVTVTISSTGTISGGTFKGWPYPAPHSLVKRIRVNVNNALNLRDLTGWGAYKSDRYRYLFDPLASTGELYCSGNQALLGLAAPSGDSLIRTGTAISAGTWVANMAIPLPMAYNSQGDYGLLSLQQNQTYYNLSIDWGQWAASSSSSISNDLVTGLTGSGTQTIAVTANWNVGYAYYDLLPSMDPTMLDRFVSITETQNPQVPTAGVNQYQPVQTDDITMILWEFVNNGLPIPSVNFSNIILQHAANVLDSSENIYMHLMRQMYNSPGARVVPMDGVLSWDYGLARGIPGRRDKAQAFNDSQITNLQMLATLPQTFSASNPSSYIIIEALRPLQQTN